MDIYFQLSEMRKIQEETLNLLKTFREEGAVSNKDKVYDLTDLEEKLHVSRRTLFK